MFRILQDSIFNPSGLIKQIKRSGWFVFLYLIVMAIFMSLGTIVALASNEDPVMNETTTGCAVVDNQIVCEGDNYDIDNMFSIYNIDVYFLNEDMTIDDISNEKVDFLVFQGDSVTLYLDNSALGSFNYFTNNVSLEDGISQLKTIIIVSAIISDIIMNLFLILAIILISTIMFTKYKGYIKYNKIFKLVTFAITPVALLITFYNLLYFGWIIFILLSFGAYRTLFVLNKELYIRWMERRLQEENNVVEQDSDEDEQD